MVHVPERLLAAVIGAANLIGYQALRFELVIATSKDF